MAVIIDEKAIAKKIRENPARAAARIPEGMLPSIPTVKDMDAQRGIAKKGPIVRYRMQVKNIP